MWTARECPRSECGSTPGERPDLAGHGADRHCRVTRHVRRLRAKLARAGEEIVAENVFAFGKVYRAYYMERLRIIDGLDALPASTGAVFTPRPEYQDAYQDLLAQQHKLYERLYA